ncbi:RDD family protein [Sorangium sp. So ce124]|uniref:RDD family protein n=1 Tax=Sorangium sp. So ce124 TaxID=3133280 RepID=UPI003F63400B
MSSPTAQPAESYNPYEPPKADASAALRPEARSRLRLASGGRRLVNLIVDYMGLMLFTFLVGVIFGLLGGAEVFERTNDTLLGLVIMFAYYVSMEAIFGATLGKLVTGTRVVMEDGSRAGLGRIALRTLCRFIPFEAFTFLTRRGAAPVGLHDGLSKTRVILVRGSDDAR